LTGIRSSTFKYYEATDTSFITGGKSAPGINEAFSAGVNFAGDLLTSIINQGLSGLVDLPGLGGVMDAFAKLLYEDVFFAFMQIPTLRAAGMSLPLPGLENIKSSVGEFHLYEGWADGSDRAFTLSALIAVRAKMWSTRARSEHTIEVSDAAPYLFGEKGYGHCFIGSRVGTTVAGYPDPNTVFVERIQRCKYSWSSDGPSGWQLGIGYAAPQDPVVKAFEAIKQVNEAVSALGIW
jgi:hypothetical protein